MKHTICKFQNGLMSAAL